MINIEWPDSITKEKVEHYKYVIAISTSLAVFE